MFRKLLRKKSASALAALPEDYQLPSFPASVLSALGKLRKSEINMHEIAADLEIDPGLHAKTLQTVNSVAFGLPHKVGNFQHAVSLLGPSRVEALVLAVVAKTTLDKAEIPDWFDMHSFWLGSARRAALARTLAQALHPGSQAEAFTAGLLQDMGVPVLATIRGEAYQAIYHSWVDVPEKDLPELEQAAFKLDHPTLGASIAIRWGFPDKLITAVSGHHLLEDEATVDLAVRIVSLVKDQEDFQDATRLVRDAAEQFSLNPSQLDYLVNKAMNDANDLVEILN